MGSDGNYEERLPCGGALQISIKDWLIRYYFAGVDARHKGTFHNIQGASVERHIVAFEDNWVEFEKLKQTVPTGGDFIKVGKMDMTIRISAYAPGVCLKYHHLPVSSKAQLDKITAGYRYAIRRAAQIQSLLRALPKDA